MIGKIKAKGYKMPKLELNKDDTYELFGLISQEIVSYISDEIDLDEIYSAIQEGVRSAICNIAKVDPDLDYPHLPEIIRDMIKEEMGKKE